MAPRRFFPRRLERWAHQLQLDMRLSLIWCSVVVDQFRVERRLVKLVGESVSAVTVHAGLADFAFQIGSVRLHLPGQISSPRQSQIHSLCS